MLYAALIMPLGNIFELYFSIMMTLHCCFMQITRKLILLGKTILQSIDNNLQYQQLSQCYEQFFIFEERLRHFS